MTRFEVLGPLRVWRGEDELDLGFPQQRALLALLLVQAGRPVPTSEIVETLWAGRPPASAVNVVRRYAGTLRRLFEPGLPPRATGRWLLRRAGGYVLEAATDDIDLLRFRDLTERGGRAAVADPEAAVRHFVAALGLWRGPVAAGIPAAVREHVRFAAVERELVRTTQLAADAALLCGQARQVLPLLRRAARREPLNEPVHARLVLTLAACGLQAEALAAYGDVRRDLAAELGTSPGPELIAAHTRVVRQQVWPVRENRQVWPVQENRDVRQREPGTRVARPAQLPSDLTVFSGRGTELDRLTTLADSAAGTRTPAIVLVSGMPGVGKTTLAVHWAHRFAHRFPDGHLHMELGGADPAGAAEPLTEVLRRALSALGVAPRRMPDGVDALAGLYRGLIAGRRVLVLLDDAAGTERVRPLLPASPGCLAVVTSRSALSGLIASGARPLRLEPLSPADAHTALARRIGAARLAAEPDAAEEIIARCGGLPLALAVVAARADSRRDVPLSAVAADLRAAGGVLDAFSAPGGTSDARAAFRCSYRSLSPDGSRLFRLLSLRPGADGTLGEAAALAGLPVRRTRVLLGELTDAHLVSEPAPGRYALHDLLRVFAAELTEAHESPAEREAARNRLAGRAGGGAAPSLSCHSF